MVQKVKRQKLYCTEMKEAKIILWRKYQIEDKVLLGHRLCGEEILNHKNLKNLNPRPSCKLLYLFSAILSSVSRFLASSTEWTFVYLPTTQSTFLQFDLLEMAENQANRTIKMASRSQSADIVTPITGHCKTRHKTIQM